MAKQGQHQQIVATSKEQFDTAVQQYLAFGYGPRQMTSDIAILVKPGQQSQLGCAFWFWLIVFFPVAIIIAVGNNSKAADSSVTIRLDLSGGMSLGAPAAQVAPLPTELTLSDDKQYWWDGTSWVHVEQSSPPMAKQNADGTLWWDGTEWQSVR